MYSFAKSLLKSLSGGILFSVLALGLATVGFAGAQAASTPSAPAASSKKTSVTGCLSKQSDGSYQLAASGQTYTLSAASSKVNLDANVGHTVKATGTVTPSTDTTSPQQLSVTALKSTSSTCSQ